MSLFIHSREDGAVVDLKDTNEGHDVVPRISQGVFKVPAEDTYKTDPETEEEALEVSASPVGVDNAGTYLFLFDVHTVSGTVRAIAKSKDQAEALVLLEYGAEIEFTYFVEGV